MSLSFSLAGLRLLLMLVWLAGCQCRPGIRPMLDQEAVTAHSWTRAVDGLVLTVSCEEKK